jgi:UDP-N-acetylglucosamine acyltransferase
MTIHQSAIIFPGVVIEDGAYIGPLCVIGAPPEHRQHTGPGYGVLIRSGARLEKMVVVDSGTKERTVIGRNAMLMHGAHVGHDCKVGEDVTLSVNATLGGHTTVLKGAFLGMNCSVHQFQIIGQYAMVAMNAMISKTAKVFPGSTWVGNPARAAGKNNVGLSRAGISEETLSELQKEFKVICPE